MAYDFEDVGDNFGWRDVAVLFEKVSLGFSDAVKGRLIPSYTLVSSAVFEV
jgi:hypothetical protein